ncbi:hypothetical protein [Rhodocyclus purpureus]|uniref:hypothetical protein n=1 Tax=Rhodocyclus purpureus TaxID=1067 RepID=UPI0019129ADC|nr:hypothetical protein [Rhodocyclus purpureus]MBK5914481.1 hypothetical protein [Rhodocyclus purpureus]
MKFDSTPPLAECGGFTGGITAFSALEYGSKKKLVYRDRFLVEIKVVKPWSHLLEALKRVYPKGARGCPGATQSGFRDFSQFVGIDLAREAAPDMTTLLKFLRCLETTISLIRSPIAT